MSFVYVWVDVGGRVCMQVWHMYGSMCVYDVCKSVFMCLCVSGVCVG